MLVVRWSWTVGQLGVHARKAVSFDASICCGTATGKSVTNTITLISTCCSSGYRGRRISGQCACACLRIYLQVGSNLALNGDPALLKVLPPAATAAAATAAAAGKGPDDHDVTLGTATVYRSKTRELEGGKRKEGTGGLRLHAL